ncbi:unnamed protein product, partial [Prorocentrum cordatum]
VGTTPHKKGLAGRAADETPIKKQKVSGTVIETAQVTAQRVATIPMISIKSTHPLSLVASAGDMLSVANEGSQDVTWVAGNLAAAFGQGKFATRASLGDFNVDQELLFNLEKSTDLVLCNNTLMTVGDAIKDRISSHPTSCKICYHDTTWDTGETTFTIERKHNVVFIPVNSQQLMEDEQNKASAGIAQQAAAARLVKPSLWDTTDTKVVWCVSWKATGLMPSRPVVVFTGSGCLCPGRSLKLEKLIAA